MSYPPGSLRDVTKKTRIEEVTGLVEVLDEPDRALLQAALLAQRQGRLNASARVVASRVVDGSPAIAWVALLMALDAAELQLGGAVKITTPSPDNKKWGSFSAQVWPSATLIALRLEHPPEGAWSLVADPLSSLTTDAAQTIARAIAIRFARDVSLRRGGARRRGGCPET